MIHYALRCVDGHSFDGWFRSSGDFDSQARGGLLDCPVCASTQVSRAIMSPRLSTSSAAPVSAAAAAERPVKPRLEAPPAMPSQLRAALQRFRAEVEQKCEYVGPRFAEAARAIHARDPEEGAAFSRPIYGEATPDEAQSLAEDGIAIETIPWVERADG